MSDRRGPMVTGDTGWCGTGLREHCCTQFVGFDLGGESD